MAAGLWRRVEGDSVVAIEKVRVVAAVARRCVRVAEEDVRDGREKALDRQRVADLEAILVVVVDVVCVEYGSMVVGGIQVDLQMLESASQSRHSPYSAMTVPLPRCRWPAQ